MEITAGLRDLLIETAKSLSGAERRRFMAHTLNKLQLGQRQAAGLFGWGRDTLRKAGHELRSGLTCADAFGLRGRKPVEFHLPHLLDDLRGLVQDHLQTDPTFQTTGLYCRLSAPEVRKQLIERGGYTAEQLPSVQTIASKLNLLGFRLRTVVKSRPQKKCRRPMPSFGT
jgi:Rhodopirellula transposase DDE domain